MNTNRLSILSLSICLASFSIIHAQNYTINTVAGNGAPGYSGDGGQATASQINGPYGIYGDASGNIYIPDGLNQRVRIVNSGGVINTFAGNGTGAFSGDGGQASSAELNAPSAIIGDAAGNIYIADGSNERIRKVIPSGFINTIAGNGTAGYSGDGGQASAAELNFPAGVAMDASGNMYIADLLNQRIRKISVSGRITTIAGNGVSGFSGDGGQATNAQLANPFGVAVDPAGNIYIADQFNNRIREVSSSGIINTIAGTGVGSYSGDAGQATAATLNRPFDVSLDAAGNIYIADYANNRIRKIDKTGIINTIAGNGAASFSGDGGPATAASLHGPTGISLDASDNLYITDQANARIRELFILCTTTATMGSQSNVLCNGAGASVTVTANSGTPPYVYSWNTAPIQTNATATGLTAGTYKVTITDFVGCTASASILITEPPAIVIGMASTQATCGNSNGTATATPTGGTGAYTYSWAPSGGNAATATSLAPSTYTVTVKDANGCTVTASIPVTNPGSLSAAPTAIDVKCNGSATGSAMANPSGGTAPYTYSWAPSGGNANTATGLTAGTYTITLTDKNGCISIATATITEPAVISIGVGSTQATCGGSNGTATATPAGGTGSYTYVWAPSGGNAATATGLSASTYTVTVTDANGCNSTASVPVTNTGSLATTANNTDIKCNGAATGSAMANPSGGTSPYTFSWAPSGGAGISATGLTAGTYTITVTDANGCIVTASAMVTQPTAIAISQGSVAAWVSDCNGIAWAVASGGTAPYNYVWNP
ncbi:MAG TPA: hypothetical protein VNZ45_18505, partial [Bacteroidia bacterium]|nr:hypothetical protein [Bacteroidia bacterium]